MPNWLYKLNKDDDEEQTSNLKCIQEITQSKMHNMITQHKG